MLRGGYIQKCLDWVFSHGTLVSIIGGLMGTTTQTAEATAPDGFLDLTVLSSDAFAPGLTAELGGAMGQAAAVCLDNQNHVSGVSFSVRGDWSRRFSISWTGPTEQARRAWGDMQDATEFGACGIAGVLITKVTDLTIVQRSRKGTGFDYWLGNKNNPVDLFQDTARLEVSGILVGDLSTVRTRTNQKLNQITKSNNHLPGYVVVVEFGTPHSVIKKARNEEDSQTA